MSRDLVILEKLEKELATELEKQRTEGTQEAEVFEKLSSGEELTRKDLRRLMREYEKEERREQEEPEQEPRRALGQVGAP